MAWFMVSPAWKIHSVQRGSMMARTRCRSSADSFPALPPNRAATASTGALPKNVWTMFRSADRRTLSFELTGRYRYRFPSWRIASNCFFDQKVEHRPHRRVTRRINKLGSYVRDGCLPKPVERLDDLALSFPQVQRRRSWHEYSRLIC